MTKKRSPNRSRKRKKLEYQPPEESRAAEGVTVAWMLCMLATIAAEFTGVMVRLVMLLGGGSPMLEAFSATMLGVAAMAGLITLMLTPVAIRMRIQRPPSGIIYTAIAAGAVPWLIIIGSILASM